MASPITASSASFAAGVRPTSHPTGYGLPSTLEPSIDHQAGHSSGSNSPGINVVAWSSPGHMPTTAPHDPNYYPDPTASYSSGSVGGVGTIGNVPASSMYYLPQHPHPQHPQ